MKKSQFTTLVCTGVLSLATSSLLAQQSPSTSNPSSSTSSPSSPSLQTEHAGTFGHGSSASSSVQSGSNVRLSQLMNASVQSQEGKTLGTVRDLLVNPQSGHIDFALLSLSSSGGASDTSTSGRETVPSSRSSTTGTPSLSSSSSSGTSGKLVPVPWQLFSQSWSSHNQSSQSSSRSGSTIGSSSASQSQNLTLNIDESKLRSAPSFDANNWNEMQEGSMDQRVYSYFGVDRNSASGASGSSISGQGTSSSSQAIDSNSSSQSDKKSSSTQPHNSSSSSSSNPDK